MSVIGFLKLILNQNPVACFYILAQNIRSEGTDIPFLGLELQFETDCVSEHRQIFRTR